MIRMLFGILGKSLLANQLTLQLVKGPSIELLTHSLTGRSLIINQSVAEKNKSKLSTPILNLSLPLKKREKRVRWTRYLDDGPYLSLNKSSKNFPVIYNWHTLIVLMMVFVLSSIIFSEFRSFSNSSSLSTCFSWFFALCLWNPFFLEECLVWSAEKYKKRVKQGIEAHIYDV